MRRDVEMHEGTLTKEVYMKLKFIYPVEKPDKITYASLAALARQGLGKKRLNPAEAAEVRAAVERHRQRQRAREQAPRDPLAKSRRWLKRLQKKMVDVIYRILHDHYRMPSARWVDEAGTYLTVSFSEPSVSVQKYEVWHRKHPWRATKLQMTLGVSVSWRADVYCAGLAEAGGLLTLAAKQVAEDAWEASWLVQKRGYDFCVERGYVVRAADGTYAHGRSLKSARAIADGRTKVWGEKLRQTHARKRAEAQARLRELRDALSRMTRDQIIAAFGDTPISLRDSIRAGNCPDGTRQWINKWADGRTSGTVRNVINTGAPLDEYLLRALAVTIARQHTNALAYHIPQGQAMSL